MTIIRAGSADEANRHSGEWVFVDLGFAEKAKSCGLLLGDGKPDEVSFSQIREKLLDVVASGEGPLNLLIEAPLSVTFNEHGNPTGRRIERRGKDTRYWYVGLGCSVLVAAMYLLRELHDASSNREIRLFEGFASFKPKGVRSSHTNDVLNLRNVVWDSEPTSGFVASADELAVSPNHDLRSAFLVAGMDFGIPAVVALDG